MLGTLSLPKSLMVIQGQSFTLQATDWAASIRSDGKASLQGGRPGFDPWVGKIPWRRGRLPTPVFWPGEFHGRRSLAGYSPWGRRESDTTETIHWFMPIKKLFAQICS